jgi:hypothetical protein
METEENKIEIHNMLSIGIDNINEERWKRRNKTIQVRGGGREIDSENVRNEGGKKNTGGKVELQLLNGSFIRSHSV